MELSKDFVCAVKIIVVIILRLQDIYKNRQLFNERVFNVASKDLLSMGITVLSYTIKDLTDDAVSYLRFFWIFSYKHVIFTFT